MSCKQSCVHMSPKYYINFEYIFLYFLVLVKLTQYREVVHINVDLTPLKYTYYYMYHML
jgi:hypothetical protein